MDYIIMENGEKILLETQQKVTIQRTVDIYKQYRKELGLTQSELGKRAGISQPNITRFESGNYNPSLEFLVKIAGTLPGVPLPLPHFHPLLRAFSSVLP